MKYIAGYTGTDTKRGKGMRKGEKDTGHSLSQSLREFFSTTLGQEFKAGKLQTRKKEKRMKRKGNEGKE